MALNDQKCIDQSILLNEPPYGLKLIGCCKIIILKKYKSLLFHFKYPLYCSFGSQPPQQGNEIKFGGIQALKITMLHMSALLQSFFLLFHWAITTIKIFLKLEFICCKITKTVKL